MEEDEVEHRGHPHPHADVGAVVEHIEAEVDEEIIKATTEYSTHIHASVEKGNLFACQFHPEKSSDLGLAILKNFAEIGEED